MKPVRLAILLLLLSFGTNAFFGISAAAEPPAAATITTERIALMLDRLRVRSAPVISVAGSCATSCGPGPEGSCTKSCSGSQSCSATCAGGRAICSCD